MTNTSTRPTRQSIALQIFRFLNEHDAEMEALAEHCGCSTGMVYKVVKALEAAGAPVHHVRNLERSKDGAHIASAEHLWSLERKLSHAEMMGYSNFLVYPEEDAKEHLEYIETLADQKAAS